MLGLFAVLALAGTMLAINGPTPDQAAIGVTDAPSTVGPSNLVAIASQPASPPSGPLASAGVAPPATEPGSPDGTAEPTASRAPRTTPRPTSTPRPTPKPTAQPTPIPTTVPTAVAAPSATPTLGPTPSPRVMCDVINLVDQSTASAQALWIDAGFTGTVLFGDPVPPHYKIDAQSLTAGATVPCASDITVQKGP